RALDHGALYRSEEIGGMHRRQATLATSERRANGLDDDDVVVGDLFHGTSRAILGAHAICGLVVGFRSSPADEPPHPARVRPCARDALISLSFSSPSRAPRASALRGAAAPAPRARSRRRRAAFHPRRPIRAAAT